MPRKALKFLTFSLSCAESLFLTFLLLELEMCTGYSAQSDVDFFVLSHASPWAAKPVCSLDAGVVLQAAPALVGSEHPQEGFEVSPGYKLQTAALKGMRCPSLHCPFISTVLSAHHSS